MESNEIWTIGKKVFDLDPNQFFEALENSKLLKNSTVFLETVSNKAANIISISSANGSVFLWDLLRPEFRIKVLKNANYTLAINESLSWSSLPVEVQAISANRLQNISNNRQFKKISSQLSAIVAQISYDMLIDINIVKQRLAVIVSEFVDYAVSELENARFSKRDKKREENNSDIMQKIKSKQ